MCWKHVDSTKNWSDPPVYGSIKPLNLEAAKTAF